MARLNEILVGRFARGLQKVFGIKGAVPTATLAPEIMPVHPLLSGVENRYVDGWNRFANFPVLGGVAADFNAVRVRNPASSNVIAVVEKLGIANQSAGTLTIVWSYGATTVDLASIFSVNTFRLDPRGQPTSALVWSFTQAASIPGLAAGQTLPQLNSGAFYDVILTENMEIPLLPGDGMQLTTTAPVNAGSLFMWIWRERFLEESERT